jgi:hypothetical protein
VQINLCLDLEYLQEWVGDILFCPSVHLQMCQTFGRLASTSAYYSNLPSPDYTLLDSSIIGLKHYTKHVQQPHHAHIDTQDQLDDCPGE